MRKLSFEDNYIPVTESGCWLWIGATNTKGYGVIVSSNASTRKKTMAHRYSYERTIGPIPEGLQIDHLCRVRCCVNPFHLEAVDARTNVLRGVGLASQNAVKTHCRYGHEFDESNTQWTKRRSRNCRTCEKKRLAEWWKRKLPERTNKPKREEAS